MEGVGSGQPLSPDYYNLADFSFPISDHVWVGKYLLYGKTVLLLVGWIRKHWPDDLLFLVECFVSVEGD